MSTPKDSSFRPDFVFGSSNSNEGFQVLDSRNRVTPEQVNDFDKICRKFAWEATQLPPEKLHALVATYSKDSLLLLHILQKLDDKKRRGLKVEGYIFPRTGFQELFKRCQSISKTVDVPLNPGLVEDNLDFSSPVLLSKSHLLQILGESQGQDSSTVPISKPIEQPRYEPSETPLPKVPEKSPKAAYLIGSFIFGLLVGTLALFFSLVMPKISEVEHQITENGTLVSKVDELEIQLDEVNIENAAQARDNTDLKRQLDRMELRLNAANNTIESYEDGRLDPRFGLQDIEQIKVTSKKMEDLAKGAREISSDHNDQADKIDEKFTEPGKFEKGKRFLNKQRNQTYGYTDETKQLRSIAIEFNKAAEKLDEFVGHLDKILSQIEDTNVGPPEDEELPANGIEEPKTEP